MSYRSSYRPTRVRRSAVSHAGPVFLAFLVIVAIIIGIVLYVVHLNHRPDSGTVYGKPYSPAWYSQTSNCMSYNSQGACTFYTYTPTYHPPSYAICIKTSEPDPGKDGSGCWDVDAGVYASVAIGSHWDRRDAHG